jgi:hypothetical protein
VTHGTFTSIRLPLRGLPLARAEGRHAGLPTVGHTVLRAHGRVSGNSGPKRERTHYTYLQHGQGHLKGPGRCHRADFKQTKLH